MVYTFRQLLDKLILAKAFSVDLDTSEQKEITNEAIEAAIVSGRWDGTEKEIMVHVGTDGILTLPRELVTCKGIRVNGSVRELASVWYTYLSQTSDLSQFSTNIQDKGDRWCVFKDMRLEADGTTTEPAQLRIACSGETSTVEVHGVDANGVDIYNGAQHGQVLTFNAAKTGSFFTRITGLIIPVTDQPATLYACYQDATEEPIGLYAPGETTPIYRRYLVQEALGSVAAPDTTTVINALCQLRHVDMIADTDICAISNFNAIVHLVRSVHWQREGDETRQIKEFNDALDMLNKELRRLKPPSEIGAMRVNAPFSVSTGLYSRR